MKCNDCGMAFNEPVPKQTQEYRIGNGSENWQDDEYTDVCPFCGSECIEEEDQDEPPVTCSRVNPVFADLLKMWGMR